MSSADLHQYITRGNDCVTLRSHAEVQLQTFRRAVVFFPEKLNYCMCVVLLI